MSARTGWSKGAQARTVGRASAQGGLAHGQHRGRQWANPADSSQLAYPSICPSKSVGLH